MQTLEDAYLKKLFREKRAGARLSYEDAAKFFQEHGQTLDVGVLSSMPLRLRAWLETQKEGQSLEEKEIPATKAAVEQQVQTVQDTAEEPVITAAELTEGEDSGHTRDWTERDTNAKHVIMGDVLKGFEREEEKGEKSEENGPEEKVEEQMSAATLEETDEVPTTTV